MNFMGNKVLSVRRSDSRATASSPATTATPAAVRSTIIAHVWPTDSGGMRDVRFHFYDMEEVRKSMSEIHRILAIYANTINYNETNHHTQGFVEKLLIPVMKRKFQESGYNIKWIEFH